jgi:hypothetical protein
MTLYLSLLFALTLLGAVGGILGGIAIYRRQVAAYQTTLENVRRLNAQLLADVRFEGLAQLRRTNAGRELLLLLEKSGELALTETAWSDSGYRRTKRMNARRKEIESRSKRLMARNPRLKSVSD